MDSGFGAIKQNSDDDIEINTDNNLKESLLHKENNNNISQEEINHNLNADDNPVIRAAYIHI